MPERLTLLLKHSVGRSKAQNPRERVRISVDGFRQLGSGLCSFAERICHVEFSKDMKCAGETIASRDLP